MHLKIFYRSEALQLAEYLSIPTEICARTPNPDMVPGVTDKYQNYLGIGAAELDGILKGMDNGWNNGQIAKELGADEGVVVRIGRIIEVTRFQRTHSVSPKN